MLKKRPKSNVAQNAENEADDDSEGTLISFFVFNHSANSMLAMSTVFSKLSLKKFGKLF